MKTLALSEFLKTSGKAVKRHSPAILTGIGITGMVSATVMAVKVTPKAVRLLEDKKRELDRSDLTAAETIKTSGRCYIPTVAMIMISILCLICANSEHSKRNAALAAAYTLSESALKEYKEKVVETIGARKEESVRDLVAKGKIEKDPVSENSIILTGKGDSLCYDAISGRYFRSDIEKLKKSVNTVNERMLNEMSISLNDFYYEIGLDGIAIGDRIGWNISRGLIEPHFSAQLAEDGTPCVVLDYSVIPDYEYY